MKLIETGKTRSDVKRIGFVMVDDSDFELLSQQNWQLGADGYPRSHGEVKLMSRFIMNAPRHLEVDHIDGNPLNNQRANLRLATSSQNKCNRGARKDCKSGYKGVSWHSQRNKWTARIKAGTKYLHLGLFEDIKDAVSAYNNAAQKYHGEFAFINKL